MVTSARVCERSRLLASRDMDMEKAIIASFPDSALLRATKCSPDPGWVTSKSFPPLPKSPDARERMLRDRQAAHRKEVEGDIQLYEDLRQHGAERLCTYDLTIAYGGDCAVAVRGSLFLKRNHILYGLKMIASIEAVLAGLRFAQNGQLALF